MRRCLAMVLAAVVLSLAKGRSFPALGLQWSCSLDPIPCKSYRPATADFMWPSFEGPRLNLVFHRARQAATFEEELDFAFGEKLQPMEVVAPKGYSLARGHGFCAAFVHTAEGRIFIGARSRSKPPLSDLKLEHLVRQLIRSVYQD